MSYSCMICDRMDYRMEGDLCPRCEAELNESLVEILLAEAFTLESGAGGRDRSTFYYSD